jgi:hypothetical protein
MYSLHQCVGPSNEAKDFVQGVGTKHDDEGRLRGLIMYMVHWLDWWWPMIQFVSSQSTIQHYGYDWHVHTRVTFG